jgi:dTMP kinase
MTLAAPELPLKINDNAWIVFEGLDATGKSTQLERIERDCVAPVSSSIDPPLFDIQPYFTHQPSGADAVGNDIYGLTERHSGDLDPLARQFLHLACHAQHYPDIFAKLEEGRPVFQDRWWWSTVAYGWFNNRERFQHSHGLDLPTFMSMAAAPTLGRQPDLLFLFVSPWEQDRHNTASVREGYQFLWDTTSIPVVRIVPATQAETSAQIFKAMFEHELLEA